MSHQIIPTTNPENHTPCLTELQSELKTIIQDNRERITKLNKALRIFAGVVCEDYSGSKALLDSVNEFRRFSGAKLTYENQRVNLRCVNSPRSKSGIYQLVTTTSGPQVLYNGKAFPKGLKAKKS